MFWNESLHAALLKIDWSDERYCVIYFPPYNFFSFSHWYRLLFFFFWMPYSSQLKNRMKPKNLFLYLFRNSSDKTFDIWAEIRASRILVRILINFSPPCVKQCPRKSSWLMIYPKELSLLRNNKQSNKLEMKSNNTWIIQNVIRKQLIRNKLSSLLWFKGVFNKEDKKCERNVFTVETIKCFEIPDTVRFLDQSKALRILIINHDMAWLLQKICFDFSYRKGCLFSKNIRHRPH